MAYDKPKVTIDLDEYTDLIQKKIQLMDFDEKYVDDYKKVFQILLDRNNNVSVGAINNYLKENNFGIQIIDTRQSAAISPEVHYKYISIIKTTK